MKDDRSYKQELSASDADFIRVLEDLIDVLISNGTIRMTDLPPEALKKLHARKQTRQRLRNPSLDLINDDDDGIL
ncbi:hypothetical protein [Paenalcaligenes suwonensis]|uniref:hypothetical protein n=1 Tax=Paenalcaligenes suwonensis TaxID=1202713 RepID=UPI00140E3D65|nr:hypothetical protein [Paenalcaligenes suwonensis]NHC63256.1 hypothetical protein [Paenalcaligenes suwonensis]